MSNIIMLYDLYYKTDYIISIQKVLTITGIVLFVLSVLTKNKVITSNCISIYYGALFGSMFGYFLGSSLAGMKIGAAAGIVIMVFINNIVGRRYILVPAYMFYMQSSYMCTYMVLYLFRIEHYVDTFIGRDVLYEEAHYSIMNMSFIISNVFAVIMMIRMERTHADKNITHMYYIFGGAVMAFCGLFSGINWFEDLIDSWQDFFLPLLGVEYGREIFVVSFIIFILLCIGCAVHTWIENKRSNK